MLCTACSFPLSISVFSTTVNPPCRRQRTVSLIRNVFAFVGPFP